MIKISYPLKVAIISNQFKYISSNITISFNYSNQTMKIKTLTIAVLAALAITLVDGSVIRKGLVEVKKKTLA